MSENTSKKQISMPFGKYKAHKISDIVKITETKDGKVNPVGKQYLHWVCSQSFPKQDLKDAIQLYLTKD